MLLRSLPDLSPANAAFRKWFYSRWGLENCIVWGRSRAAEYSPFTQTLSIKAAWGGAEVYRVDNRMIPVDDDNFLILNHERTYSSVIRSETPVESFAIFFRPGLAEEFAGAFSAPLNDALDSGGCLSGRNAEFSEALQPHDRSVTPVLRYIKANLALGLDDESWYEEQLHFLLERVAARHHRIRAEIQSMPLARVTTRREVHRRIALATDFLHATYPREITLDDLARVACLSKYHFLRLFTVIHGLTPHAYLQRKRAQVAQRLLQSTRLTTDQVASQVGFAERSSMFRQLRRWTGRTPRELRRARRQASG
jgi:AraC family transcriptional regulator